VRAYLRGDKKNANENKHQDLIDTTGANFSLADTKKDIRLDRMKIKQKRTKDAQEQRHNYGLINTGYDMYRNDRPFASAYGDDFRKSQFHPDEWFVNNNGQSLNPNSREIATNEDWNDNVASVYNEKKSFSKTNTYDIQPNKNKVHPKSLYNGYVVTAINQDPHSVDTIVGDLNSYRQKISINNNPRNEMDYDHKMVIPNNKCNGKRDTENNYKSVPFMQGDNIRDIDIDTYMRFGTTPSRNGKSLGYPNPMEHYFTYISSDIQDPVHAVSNRGMPSRQFNKQEGELEHNKREILH
jgi:hypothetical protein